MVGKVDYWHLSSLHVIHLRDTWRPPPAGTRRRSSIGNWTGRRSPWPRRSSGLGLRPRASEPLSPDVTTQIYQVNYQSFSGGDEKGRSTLGENYKPTFFYIYFQLYNRCVTGLKRSARKIHLHLKKTIIWWLLCDLVLELVEDVLLEEGQVHLVLAHALPDTLLASPSTSHHMWPHWSQFCGLVPRPFYEEKII